MGIFGNKNKRKSKLKVDFLDIGNDFKHQKFGDTRLNLVDNVQDYQRLNNLYHTNGIVRKVVSKPAEDATRNGWRIVIPSDTAKQAQYQQALDKLNLKRVLADQLIYQRLHGDGYISYGIVENHTTEQVEPVNLNNINDVAFVHAFGQTHVDSYETNNDPTSLDYSKESRLTIKPNNEGYKYDDYGNAIPIPVSEQKIQLDASRYGHISLDKMEDDKTGNSIITRCFDQIHVLDQALETTGKVLREYTFKAFMSDAYFNSDIPDQRKMKQSLEYGMDAESVLMLKNGESISKIGTNVSGIDTLLTFAWEQLSATCNIPKSVLTGEQAGTLAGATQDVANYYDGVKSMQEQLLLPELKYIVRLLMCATNVADGYEDPDSIDWHIEFNPLWSPDDKTMADTNLVNTQAAVARVGAGMQAPDEAMQALNSLGNNNVQSMQNLQGDSLDADKIISEIINQYKQDLRRAHGKSS